MPKKTALELAAEKLMLRYTQVIERSSSWCANCRANVTGTSICQQCGVMWIYVATSPRLMSHEEATKRMAEIRPNLHYIGWVEARDPRFRASEKDPCAGFVELFA